MIKTDKALLSIQILLLLPIAIFVLVYFQGIYTLFALPILVLLGYSFYSYYSKKKIIHYPMLMILLVSFLLYAFYGLGSKEAPQEFENLTLKHRSVVFTFDKPTTIDKFVYYIGIDSNSKFNLQYWDKEKWKTLYKYDKSFPFSFRWNRVDFNKTVVSKVRLHLSKGELMLGEVRFMNADAVVEMKTDNFLLNDNIEMVENRTYFGGMFFDEIYHGRTAYELIHGLKVYETTHPYLGKWLITPGIKIFGMTPFGWRLTNVLFGVLFIVMVYYFVLELFREEYLALAGSLMMSYSFMHFTQVRLALIDTFGVLFVFVSYYFLYRFIKKQTLRSLLLSGMFFGLASAIKWSALFASIGFIFIALYLLLSKYPLKKQFTGYRLILYGLLSYLGVGLIVYTLSFFDIYMRTGSFQSIIDYQVNMYNYHSALQATHAYSSDWWSWALDMKPMCYYREIVEERFSSITVFGNPALFWIGVVSIFYISYVAIRKRVLEATFILLAFLGLYLPYIFVGRMMFIYHFYYAVPFMFLAILYFWRDVLDYAPKFRKLFFLYLVIVVLLFLMFYPVLSGYEVPKSYVDNYLVWFNGWWL